MMRTKSSFILQETVSLLALILSALTIAAVCVIPQAMIKRLSERMEPMVSRAIEYTQAELPERALMEIAAMKELLLEASETLMDFYDHGGLQELYYAARTAEELAQAGDKTQLLTELTAIECGLRRLRQINEASLCNLF